jgi:hypothetical protein
MYDNRRSKLFDAEYKVRVNLALSALANALEGDNPIVKVQIEMEGAGGTLYKTDLIPDGEEDSVGDAILVQINNKIFTCYDQFLYYKHPNHAHLPESQQSLYSFSLKRSEYSLLLDSCVDTVTSLLSFCIAVVELGPHDLSQFAILVCSVLSRGALESVILVQGER